MKQRYQCTAVLVLACLALSCSAEPDGDEPDSGGISVQADAGSDADRSDSALGDVDDADADPPTIDCESGEWANGASDECLACSVAVVSCESLDFGRRTGSWDHELGVLTVPLAIDRLEPASVRIQGKYAWSGGGPVSAGESVTYDATGFTDGFARFEIPVDEIPEDKKIRVDQIVIEDACGSTRTLEVFWSLEKLESSELRGGSCTTG